jgi:hypothetical protein
MTNVWLVGLGFMWLGNVFWLSGIVVSSVGGEILDLLRHGTSTTDYGWADWNGSAAVDWRWMSYFLSCFVRIAVFYFSFAWFCYLAGGSDRNGRSRVFGTWQSRAGTLVVTYAGYWIY